MKKILSIILIIFSIMPAFMPAFSQENQVIKLKFGSLGPKGTSANLAIEIAGDVFGKLQDTMNAKIKIIGYYGGIMGDDLQMVQKAKMGQLDLVTPTVNGLPNCVKEIEAFYMAYLIENYGQFDYVMNKNSRYLNNLFFTNGWIIFANLTEGAHELYMDSPYKTPEELREKLKAANYTGGPDDTFFKAMNIPQIPVQPTEMFPAFKSGISNAAILPSMFVIGMQIYTALPYIIEPPIRISMTSVLLTKRKWLTLPWDFKVYLPIIQPLMYYWVAGLMRDTAEAYSDAMLKRGCKKIQLTDGELKKWKDAVISYRNTYLENDKIKREICNNILKAVKEYTSGYPIERAIYEKDPTYKNFPDRGNRIARAIDEYVKTGSKAAIADLEKDKIIERWRLYDLVDSVENYIKTKNPKMLKDWMSSYYITEVVDEIFSKHMDSVNKLMGSQKALNDRLKEVALFFTTPLYKGYQKLGTFNKN